MFFEGCSVQRALGRGELRLGQPKTKRSHRALVLPKPVGTPIDPSNFRRHLSAITQRAGFGHWHPHELRHSAVSLLSAAGLRLEEIADVLGHSSTRMTGDVYRHAVLPAVSAGVHEMEQLFDPD